ncbi:hypothetical protein PGTUg99_017804 [Puccinia graminis f. sp. tritici]|uniref:Uncharacterized protein n=1 Tax=Puccinia graminis f. sp. tritici TaxID=56615 RepID=A0A5B0Q808_PUCGR|nr:hypothetical protein PGTUg99_017804 [Puccinia graminis f. sp. tritici]
MSSRRGSGGGRSELSRGMSRVKDPTRTAAQTLNPPARRGPGHPRRRTTTDGLLDGFTLAAGKSLGLIDSW